jgi:hypothetical protein
MAEEPNPTPQPTYSEHAAGQRTIYTCLIEDAGRELGICGHMTTDEGYMTQHMQQRHAGIMVKTFAPPPGATVQSAPTPPVPEATSQRTVESQEHPPGLPAEQVQPLAQAEDEDEEPR